jgi:hypothetical protein
MSKRNKIIYWIATCWLALGMVSTGLVQILKVKEEADMITQLGYPLYFMTILGTWKLLGVVAILVPKFPVVKEWAYAGFFFAMSGAILSHAANGDTDPKGFFAPLLLIVLTITSWYFRPADRKTGAVNL